MPGRRVRLGGWRAFIPSPPPPPLFPPPSSPSPPFYLFPPPAPPLLSPPQVRSVKGCFSPPLHVVCAYHTEHPQMTPCLRVFSFPVSQVDMPEVSAMVRRRPPRVAPEACP